MSDPFLGLYCQLFLPIFSFLQLLYIESGSFLYVVNLTVAIQPDMKSRFVVGSQLSPSIQSGFFPCAGLQVVTQFTHLLKDCYSQLVLNPHCSEVIPTKQLDYRCIPFHLWSVFFCVQTEYGDLQKKTDHKSLHIYLEIFYSVQHVILVFCYKS